MKRILILLFAFASIIGYSQGDTPIKFSLPDDPISGNKVKVLLTGANFDYRGKLVSISYIIKLTNQADQEISPTSEIQDAAFFSKEKVFFPNGKAILSTTRVYSPLVDGNGVAIPNAILISEYLQMKPINQFKNPNDTNLAGGDASWKFLQSVLKEVVLIKQANGELPI